METLAVLLVGAPLDYVFVGYPIFTIAGLGVILFLDIMKMKFTVLEEGNFDKG